MKNWKNHSSPLYSSSRNWQKRTKAIGPSFKKIDKNNESGLKLFFFKEKLLSWMDMKYPVENVKQNFKVKFQKKLLLRIV